MISIEDTIRTQLLRQKLFEYDEIIAIQDVASNQIQTGEFTTAYVAEIAYQLVMNGSGLNQEIAGIKAQNIAASYDLSEKKIKDAVELRISWLISPYNESEHEIIAAQTALELAEEYNTGIDTAAYHLYNLIVESDLPDETKQEKMASMIVLYGIVDPTLKYYDQEDPYLPTEKNNNY